MNIKFLVAIIILLLLPNKGKAEFSLPNFDWVTKTHIITQKKLEKTYQSANKQSTFKRIGKWFKQKPSKKAIGTLVGTGLAGFFIRRKLKRKMKTVANSGTNTSGCGLFSLLIGIGLVTAMFKYVIGLSWLVSILIPLIIIACIILFFVLIDKYGAS